MPSTVPPRRTGPLPGIAGDVLLRRTLRRHAAGVTIVTVPGPAGFTATSFTSVSLRPPLVSFCVDVSASAAGAVRTADRFAVHLLGAHNAALAGRFARGGIDRFAGTDVVRRADGVPVLTAAPAWLAARTVLQQRLGDHLLVVGEVYAGGVREHAAPLVHHDGGYATAWPLPLTALDGT
ncbi:flavin reductase family protein [Streptomyces pactum]|uniref:Flavin reductase family protein n=1 Tax=Streptomyces pactum TaxID=68249 RepID=A0ABS0NRC8_9ACTN|nr:flavin reductase family protein [Streptomyces pactum]MBH5337762.1 flavin reductase family protein [Streptomyces pactum]